MAAKKTKLQDLIKDLEKGKLVSADQVRKTLQTLEINTLRLTAEELNKLIKVIEVKKTGEFPATRKAGQTLETLISEGIGTDDGGIELANTTYSQLATIGKEIGRGQEFGYQLGHTGLGNLAQALGFILKYYKVNGQRHLTQEESRLLESAILGAQTIERLPDKNLEELRRVNKKDSDTLYEALAFIPEGLEHDLVATSKFVSNLGLSKITYVFEDKTQNQAKGDLSKILSTKVRSFLKNLNKASDDAIGKRLERILIKVTDPFNISSSPTFIDSVEEVIDDTFFERKKTKKSKTSKVRVHRRVPVNRAEAKKLREIIKRRTANLVTLAKARQQHKKFIVPTITLKAIINESLALYIKNRMGKAADPAVQLRYQTGRFAESARLLTLNRTETGALVGSYDFMRDPYGTFLPGGRLHTQQRDPKIYIEGAIRDIAVQVLKRQFNGIALELK